MSEHPNQPDFEPSGFFALRTPLLPFDELLSWGAGLDAPANRDPSRLAEALAADRSHLRGRLRAVVARPDVREALFVASPDLEERLDVWLREPDCEAGQKMERALVRYFSRMAGRATPFGLFAGCSVGTVSSETRLVIADRAGYQRHTRLDMDYVVALTEALARDPTVQNALDFSVNSSLYRVNGRICFAEVRRNGKGWTHHQVALEASDYLAATLARANAGAAPAALATALVDDDRATLDGATLDGAALGDAREYVAELISNQVLISELHPTVTGPEPIHGLVARLREQTDTTAGKVLEDARFALAALDAGGLGADPARYREIARRLESLPGKVELGRLFQVDMIKPAVDATLGQDVLGEIVRGVTILHRLARPPREDPLVRFREAFVTRYEGREVPLVEVLDTEAGIGFDKATGASTEASSLLEDLTFPQPVNETASWGKRDALLLRHLSDALTSGRQEISLSPRDLEEMSNSTPLPLPSAFAVMAAVAAPSEAAFAAGDFRVLLEGGSGPSGARLLGRFCHADPALCRHVEEHIRAEEALQPDALFAEVVHLPEGRMGNVLARPTLRAYEIPHLGRSSVPAPGQIPVSDLLVSVAGDQIVLRSARLGRRVVPRLTSAHNFSMSQGMYRFLCALQTQGTVGDFSWDWGVLRDAPFLPRVVTGRLVLSPARWQARREELRTLDQADDAARFQAVQAWRANRQLPRWIALADMDNELPIDLDNVFSVETLVGLINKREQATLVEFLPGPDELCARGPEGRFVHELVVPFIRRLERDKTQEATERRGDFHTAPAVLPPAPRRFPPGSEWLYAKLYTGSATADQVLREVVRPVSQAAVHSGAADSWFFIRYGDPDWHVRLRFHGDPQRLLGEVLPALRAATLPLLEDGRVWRFQLDTYEREIERYGGAEGIGLAEQLFQADSEAVLALVEQSPEDARGDARWRWALQGMDQLLIDLGLDLAGKLEVIRRTRDAFAKEFCVEPQFRHQLNAKYRKERRTVEALLVPDGEGQALPTPEHAVLHRRSEQWASAIADLKAREQAGKLRQSVKELAVSYLHMHANRLLRSAHRAQELVLYDFLARNYESRVIRERDRVNRSE